MRRVVVFGQPSKRLFSTSYSRGNNHDIVDLAYTRHDPPTTTLSTSRTASRSPIVVMHGLFGSQRNNRTFSKVLAKELSRQVYLLDLRNHGESPHHPTHTYTALARDVEAFLQQHALVPSMSGGGGGRSAIKPILIGHSMGAKVAMTLALRQPSHYSGLVPIDNSPVDAALKSDFGKYVQGMLEVEGAIGQGTVKKQSDADAILAKYEDSLPIRQFLLTNLVKPSSTASSTSSQQQQQHQQQQQQSQAPSSALHWRVPLSTLQRNLDNMADFPFKSADEARFEGPCLVIRGGESRYVADDVLPVFGAFFPRFELCDIKGAGHWVVSERFEECVEAVVEWASRCIDGDGDVDVGGSSSSSGRGGD